MREKSPQRKQIRLKEYDYSTAGYYFITMCTQNRKEILGKIKNQFTNESVGAESISARIELKHAGKMINRMYQNLEKQFYNIRLHNYCIMPNHIHGIIKICQRADMESAPTINQIIQTFKRHTTIAYIKGVKEGKYEKFSKRIWQRNYYEHVIRNEKEYYKIVEYIQNNVMKWKEDKYFNY